MKTYKHLLSLSLLLMVSCSQHKEPELNGTSSLRLSIIADESVVPLFTKASEPTLTAEMFKVRIENQDGSTFKSWDSFVEMPSPVNINAGDYRIVAFYGNPELPVWDTPYYEGANNFAIVAGEEKDVNLTCQLAATKVQVNFDESFDLHYSSYSVDISTSSEDDKFLNFDPDTQQRAAYFTPGVMTVKFRLTARSDNQTYFFSPDPIATTEARESYTFNMSAKINQGVNSIEIVTDESTNDKEPIEIIIPRN